MARANYSYKVKFFIFEPVALGPLLLLMLFQTKLMLIIAVSITVFLWVLSFKGLTLTTLSRKTRTSLIGKVRYIRPFWRKEL